MNINKRINWQLFKQKHALNGIRFYINYRGLCATTNTYNIFDREIKCPQTLLNRVKKERIWFTDERRYYDWEDFMKLILITKLSGLEEV